MYHKWYNKFGWQTTRRLFFRRATCKSAPSLCSCTDAYSYPHQHEFRITIDCPLPSPPADRVVGGRDTTIGPTGCGILAPCLIERFVLQMIGSRGALLKAASEANSRDAVRACRSPILFSIIHFLLTSSSFS